MPKLWSETIQEHRQTIHDAILSTTWALVAERGLLAVTMTQIAEAAGIGRATLYKYFPDVESIILAGHARHMAGHLEQLVALRERTSGADARLAAVLEAYALIAHHRGQHGTPEVAALVHRGEHVAPVHQELLDLFRDLLDHVAGTGRLRNDVAPAELASYCLHALSGAGALPDEAAVRRLVQVTLSGLRPPL